MFAFKYFFKKLFKSSTFLFSLKRRFTKQGFTRNKPYKFPARALVSEAGQRTDAHLTDPSTDRPTNGI